MRWANHQMTAFSLTFLITGNTFASVIATAGANFPDVVEFTSPGFFSKHRGMSHSIFYWAGAYTAALILCLLLFKGFHSFIQYMSYFFLGILLHLLTDAASTSGIPLLRGKRIALGLYKTYGVSEYIVVVAVVLICFIIRPPAELITSLGKNVSSLFGPK